MKNVLGQLFFVFEKSSYTPFRGVGLILLLLVYLRPEEDEFHARRLTVSD
jgi:hypothetical protein